MGSKVSHLSLSEDCALPLTVSRYDPTASKAPDNKMDKLAVLISFRLDIAVSRLCDVSMVEVLKSALHCQTVLSTPLNTQRSANWLFKWKTG